MSSAAPQQSVSALTIEQSLKAALEPKHLEVEDTSGGCGASFQVLIVSQAFQGKSLLQRHRLVNDVLKDQLPHVHAFSQKCLTVEQWEQQQ